MKFFQGLHIDNHPSDQPEGTYRDAKNIVLDDQRGAVANERGFVDTSLLPANYMPLGRAVLPDDRIVLFSADGEGGSEIGIIENDGKYYTLVNDPRLNFSLEHPITAIARLVPQRFTSEAVQTPVTEEFTEQATLDDEAQSNA